MGGDGLKILLSTQRDEVNTTGNSLPSCASWPPPSTGRSTGSSSSRWTPYVAGVLAELPDRSHRPLP